MNQKRNSETLETVTDNTEKTKENQSRTFRDEIRDENLFVLNNNRGTDSTSSEPVTVLNGADGKRF